MPITKSAQKKMKQDKKRTTRNSGILSLLKKFIKKATKEPTQENIINAIKVADKAAKKNIIAQNKAARIKSKLSSFSSLKETKAKAEKVPETKSKTSKKKTTK